MFRHSVFIYFLQNLLNIFSFQECLFRAATMPNQNTTCNHVEFMSVFNLKQDRFSSDEFCSVIIKIFHGKLEDLWQKCTLMLGMVNSLVNPVIYAFWYSQFRLRIVQTWKNFFTKSCRNPY